MEHLGNKIRLLRKSSKITLRVIADSLKIDVATLSKMERGQRKPTREQVIKLANFFKVKENDLLAEWLSDKLVYELAEEDLGLQALQLAEEKVIYETRQKRIKTNVIKALKSALEKDGRVKNAWVFGSFARGSALPGSDVDIIVELNTKKKYSFFDLIDISFLLEKKIKLKVDLVEKEYLKDFALQSAKNDIVKIYG